MVQALKLFLMGRQGPVNTVAADDLGPLLLTWFNFNPSMDK